jgi:hypothetical protein
VDTRERVGHWWGEGRTQGRLLLLGPAVSFGGALACLFSYIFYISWRRKGGVRCPGLWTAQRT